MNKYKRKFVLYFLVCFVGFIVMEDVLTALLEFFTSRMQAERAQQLAVVFFLLITLLNLVCSAWLFSWLIGREFQKENKRRLDERNMLYSCIAHDLRTPMTSVQGFAAALKEGRVKPEEQQEIYGIIYNKSCYMNELLDTMFAYAKLNTEGYTLSPEELDICALVRELAALHYDAFEQRQMELTIDVPEEGLLIHADRKELKRAISNLVANACKHNASGAEILIRLSAEGNTVRIGIADNGQPIDPETAKTMFEPFARGDASRSGGGSGLGLAIARLTAQKHGGSLTVEKGTDGYTKAFVLTLRKK